MDVGEAENIYLRFLYFGEGCTLMSLFGHLSLNHPSVPIYDTQNTTTLQEATYHELTQVPIEQSLNHEWLAASIDRYPEQTLVVA